jgi:hypothetical protein
MDINGGNMVRRSPETIPVLELTSNVLLLQAAPLKRRSVNFKCFVADVVFQFIVVYIYSMKKMNQFMVQFPLPK